MKDLRDRVAVVTGAAGGIGRAIALELGRAGCRLVLNDLTESPLDGPAREIRRTGRAVVLAPADLANAAEATGVIRTAMEAFGRIDILINNAGVGVGGRMERIPHEAWEWIMGVNLWAHIHTVRAVLPHFVERGEGHLVHVASAAGLVAMGSMLPYSVTKFAVVGLAEALAQQVRPLGIGVTVVCPANVKTPIAEASRCHFGSPEKSDEALDAVRAFADAGIAPERVARKVVQAIRKDRFFVSTHGFVRPFAVARALFPDTTVRVAGWLDRRMMGYYTRRWRRAGRGTGEAHTAAG
ncbi:MAG: SDR family oxidoreductase [Nitrospirae bacterium]|nr:SDR family oxidoreductase [Nitrospirota bacterium]